MRKFRLFSLVVIVSSIIVSCSTVSPEQKLVQDFEGENVKIESFEANGVYTYADSVAFWENALQEKLAEFLAQMDTAEARLIESNRIADEQIAKNSFPVLTQEFVKTKKENELLQLRIKINREQAKTDGGDTPLKPFYEKVESLKEKGEEVIYNQYKAKIIVDGEQVSRTYYLAPDNSKVVKTDADK